MDIAATLTAIGGIVIAIISFSVALFTQRSAASKVEVDSLRSTIEHLTTQNTKLGERVDVLQRKNDKLREWAEALVCQVRDLGGIPVKMEE